MHQNLPFPGKKIAAQLLPRPHPSTFLLPASLKRLAMCPPIARSWVWERCLEVKRGKGRGDRKRRGSERMAHKFRLAP